MNCGPYRHEGAKACEARLDRTKFAPGSGRPRRRHWRGIEELADTESFRALAHREFPAGASEWRDEISRRQFRDDHGGILRAGGMTACTKQPVEKIIPYVEQPPEITPGKPLYFARAMPFAGYGMGVIVHEPRRASDEDRRQSRPSFIDRGDEYFHAGQLA